MFCSSCGAQMAPGSAYCSQCGKPFAGAGQSGVSLDKAGPAPMQRPAVGDDDLPPSVAGWSWGAFVLNWIWAIGNRTWLGLLALIPWVGFFVALWLGFKGREMAWRNGRWDSVEHFKRVQRRWSQWGVGLLLAGFVIGIVAAIMESDAPDSLASSGMTQEDAWFADGQVFDSGAQGLPTKLVTSAGTLARTTRADGKRAMTLSGKPLFTGEDAQWQFPVRSFNQSKGREAVLMASSGGRGNSCDTLFYFLLIDGDQVRNTPLFGTCAPEGRLRQRGDLVELALPKMGGMSQAELRDGEIVEDGRTITLDNLNDPAR